MLALVWNFRWEEGRDGERGMERQIDGRSREGWQGMEWRKLRSSFDVLMSGLKTSINQ